MADVSQFPPGFVEDAIKGWKAQIAEVDPEILGLLQERRELLERALPLVERVVGMIHPLSARWEGAFNRAARELGVDPMARDTDLSRELLDDEVGITALYDLAGRLERALPDNCDCAKHGCAKLAGIPTERAD